MFLDALEDLHLLVKDANTDVLGRFPLSVRKVLIHEVTKCLLPTQEINAPSLLTSYSHVQWAMEVVGQGFALPIDEIVIMQNCVSVYSSWLMERETRPLGMKDLKGTDQEQDFWQTIFKHFSLVFKPRPSPLKARTNVADTTSTPEELLRRHIEMCKYVLRILNMAARTLGSEFSQATWLVLIKVLVGVTDTLLKEPLLKELVKEKEGKDKDKSEILGAEGAHLAQELCEPLIRIVFEVYLRSKVATPEVWSFLSTLFPNWLRRPEIVVHWSSTILALTLRVIRLLYGGNEGAEMVNIVVNQYNVGLDVPAETIYPTWHSIIYLLPNPNSLVPFNFNLAIVGISKTIDAFLSLNTCPDGNTLLHMFGDWLFEATRHSQSSYEEGKSEAYGALCRIFTSPQERPFENIYLGMFYEAMKRGLLSDGLTLTSIIINCGTLFIRGLKGVRLLVPDFICAFERILPRIEKGLQIRILLEDLRRHAFKIMATIFALPNHLENVPLRIFAEELSQSDLMLKYIKTIYKNHDDFCVQKWEGQTFILLKSRLLNTLLQSFIVEQNVTNVRYLIHVLTCFVVEDVASCSGLAALVIRSIEEKIFAERYAGLWSNEIFFTTFECLNHLTGNWEYIKKDGKSCIRDLVITLCRFIDSVVEDRHVSHHLLIVRAYDCAVRWALCGHWLKGDRVCFNTLIATLCRGVGIMDHSLDYSQVGDVAAYTSSGDSISIAIQSILAEISTSLGDAPSGLPSRSNPQSASNATVNMPVEDSKRTRQKTGVKLFNARPHMRSSTAGLMSVVSTGTKDAGVGLPTFAVLSAEVSIKMSAETNISQILNHFGNFPVWGERTGVSKMSTAWCEIENLRNKITLEKGFLLDNQEEDKNAKKKDMKRWRRHIRFYAIENRAIVGIVEQPLWFTDSREKSKENLEWVVNPSFVITFRDCTGRYSWISALKYLSEDELLKQTMPHESHVPSVSSIDVPSARPRASFNPTPLSNEHILFVEGCNDDKIPRIQSLFLDREDSAKELQTVNTWTTRQREEENYKLVASALNPKLHQASRANPPELKSLTTHHDEDAIHRLFFTHFGFMSLQNRKKLVPLQFSESLLKDLDKLDKLPERECVGVTVFFLKTVHDHPSDIFMSGDMSLDFENFLQSLGWMVQLDEHLGYKSFINYELCRTTPYYANRSHEVAFLVPNLCQHDGDLGKQEFGHSSFMSKAGSMDLNSSTASYHPQLIVSSSMDREDPKLSNPTRPSFRFQDPVRPSPSNSLKRQFVQGSAAAFVPTSNTESLASTPLTPFSGTTSPNSGQDDENVDAFIVNFNRICEDHIINIVWLEDLKDVGNVPRALRTNSFMFIVIHPLPKTPGLYLIRIIASTTLPDDPLVFGPLVDGMTVSRHALGVLVRNMAIAGHMQCRYMKGSHKRPYAARRQVVEDLIVRNKAETKSFFAEAFR